MKRFVPAALIGLCVLLLACSESALNSASEALALWWTRVLPALFPFYVLTTLLSRYGLLERMCKLLHSPVLPCFLLGAIGGYPTGARVCALLKCEQYAVTCNLCSPMFLLGVVAIGLCGNASVFAPLALAHYGSALLLFAVQRFFTPRQTRVAAQSPPVVAAPDGNFITDIAAGMQAMLGVGGCIVFFYVPVNTLLSVTAAGRLPLLSSVFIGFAELTSGCRHVAALGLPINVQCALLAFFITFGGLCVFAQAMLVANLKRPLTYLLGKAAQGCLAAGIAYFTAPLFIRSAVTVLSSNARPYAENAIIGAAFFVSAAVGLVSCYLIALVARRSIEA